MRRAETADSVPSTASVTRSRTSASAGRATMRRTGIVSKVNVCVSCSARDEYSGYGDYFSLDQFVRVLKSSTKFHAALIDECGPCSMMWDCITIVE